MNIQNQKAKNTTSGLDLTKLRNIGIIAHIDAGKTTTTERCLFYSGIIHRVGDVHYGNTTTDWMQQEKERGITIVSASIQFNWNDHMVNLIDTPGHIDFNFEVEKCLSVLDGAVCLIDGSAGVEPQTECVWGQAHKYEIARLVFINKMDKDGANFDASITSLKNRLSDRCVAIVEPVIEDFKFIGIYDLVKKCKYIWPGRDHNYELFTFDQLSELEQGILDEKRLFMIEKMAEVDDEILNIFIEGGEMDNDFLKQKIVELTHKRLMFPVLAGSSFHNKGVQPMLDAIIDYLPNPTISKCFAKDLKSGDQLEIKIDDKPMSAFVFKLIHDAYAGEISYIRLYSGSIKPGDVVFNSRTSRKIKVQNVIRFHVTARKQVEEAFAGDVVGIVAEDALTADTISSLDRPVFIQKIDVPESVVDFAIVPETKSDQDKFAKYINLYLKEDPTIGLRFDSEQRESIISGVGKLQIEILVDRLRTERGINLSLSKPKIAYRETITKEVSEEHLHKKQTGGAGQFAGITIEMFPSKKTFEFQNKITGGAIPRQYIPEIEKACKETLACGILNKSPVINVGIRLIDGRFHDVDSSSIAFALATREVVLQALRNAEPILLEPIFKMNVNTPSEYMNSVIGDIYSKEGNIINVTIDNTRSTEYRHIECDIPLRNIFDYADSLRSITKGMANFTYSFAEYRRCDKNIQDK